MNNSNLQINLDRLSQIRESQPAATHIIMRRDDDRMVDIPVAQAEFTIRQHPTWTVEEGVFPKVELAVVNNVEELPVLPPKPSEQPPVDAEPVKPEPVDTAPVLPPLTEPDVKLPAKPKARKKKE